LISSKVKHYLSASGRLHSDLLCLDLIGGLRIGGVLELNLVTSLKGRLTEVRAGGTTEGITEVAFAAVRLNIACFKVLLCDLAFLKFFTAACAVFAGLTGLELVVFSTEFSNDR